MAGITGIRVLIFSNPEYERIRGDKGSEREREGGGEKEGEERERKEKKRRKREEIVKTQ